MNCLEIEINKSAKKELINVPNHMQNKVIILLDNILKQKKLSQGYKKIVNTQYYRYRVGDYRILFLMKKEIMIITKISHRKESYKKI